MVGSFCTIVRCQSIGADELPLKTSKLSWLGSLAMHEGLLFTGGFTAENMEAADCRFRPVNCRLPVFKRARQSVVTKMLLVILSFMLGTQTQINADLNHDKCGRGIYIICHLYITLNDYAPFSDRPLARSFWFDFYTMHKSNSQTINFSEIFLQEFGWVEKF